jgi:glyoxalase family protein
MIHRLRWRVGSDEALGFWAERLSHEGVEVERGSGDRALAFRDPEGLGLELAVVDDGDEPLRAQADGIPPEHALLGFDGVRAFSATPEREEMVLTRLMGFEMTAPGAYELRGGRRRATYVHDDPPPARGVLGAGTVHHIAWCDHDADHPAWRERLQEVGAQPTPIIDRQYFLSIYFREPRGVLFELATPSPGFAIDEDPEHLGEELRLPPQYEHMREELERILTPLVNPRAKAARR